MPAFLDLDDPVEPSMRSADRPRRGGRGGGAGRARHHQFRRRFRQLVAQPSRCWRPAAGFAGHYTRSNHSVSATAIAGTGTGMQRDYDYSSAVHGADLEDPAALGRRAAERALARLNPARPKTAKLPVVFDPRVSGSFLGHLVRRHQRRRDRARHLLPEGQPGRSGSSRRASASSTIRCACAAGAPARSTARASPAQRRAFIEDGVLTSWILDTRSANQLGLKTTGHAGGHSAISTSQPAR